MKTKVTLRVDGALKESVRRLEILETPDWTRLREHKGKTEDVELR